MVPNYKRGLIFLILSGMEGGKLPEKHVMDLTGIKPRIFHIQV
jgi:hypothetical protein